MSLLTSTERLHRDTLARFLFIATERPLRLPENALAEAVGKTFFPSDVYVRWRTSLGYHQLVEELGSWTAPRGERLRGDHLLQVPTLSWIEGGPLKDYRLASVSANGMEGLRIRKSRGNNIWQELEIILCRFSQTSRIDPKFDDFRRSITGSKLLFQTFLSLKAARLTPHIPDPEWGVRMEQTTYDLLHFQCFPGTAHLQERLLDDFLDSLFAADRDIDEIAGPEGATALAGLALQFGYSTTDSSPRLQHLQEILAAATDTDKDKEESGAHGQNSHAPGDAQSILLRLIATWTRLHARARNLLRRGFGQVDHAAFEAEFLRKAHACRPALCELLRSVSWTEGVEISRLSPWLRLWFCMTLLHEPARIKEQKIEVERLGFYGDLAYAVRESLRAFQEKATPRFHLPSLSSALGTLVEYHATKHLKLPQDLNLSGILSEIGQMGLEAGDRFPTGHLHHVLEMYIGGMFLLETRLAGIAGSGEALALEGATICQALLSQGGTIPGPDNQLALRQSFGLSALLHDIGVLLFPHWSRRAAGLGSRQNGLYGRLQEVRDALAERVRELLATCRDELLAAGVFKDSTEPAISDWFARCADAGEADHSILGAWYLMHHGKGVVGTKVLEKAARAVLFHSIPIQEIRPEEDPAAALLVLCDEIFAWHEGRDLPRIRRNRNESAAAGAEPRGGDSIFRCIRWPGLRIEEYEATGQLVPTLDLVQNLALGEARTWPWIELDLKDEERLPLRVYEYWLLSSQSLRRLRTSETGWGPRLLLRSRAPEEPSALATRELLARAGRKTEGAEGNLLRPYLRRWLELHGDPVRDEGFETVVLCPVAEELGANGRIEALFPELAHRVEEVLREVERRRRVSGSR